MFARINFYDMKNSSKGRDKSRYSQLSELGSKLNLSFSSHVSLGSKMIALDGIKRKLLVLDINNASNEYYIIQLDEVKVISVKKNYSWIQPGELNKKGFEEFLETIFLYFEYRDKGHTVALPFYERGKNSVSNLPMLERNARNWQMILSKMITPKTTGVFKETSRVLSTA